jgi:hypothetical protein
MDRPIHLPLDIPKDSKTLGLIGLPVLKTSTQRLKLRFFDLRLLSPFVVIDLLLGVPGVTCRTLVASKSSLPRDYKKIELSYSDNFESPRSPPSTDILATFRRLLNTKRYQVISITRVNDTLISELISSGVIMAESDFTQSDVRWD